MIRCNGECESMWHFTVLFGCSHVADRKGSSIALEILKFIMGFGDLKSSAGLSALNNFLADRSYIEG